MKRTFPPFATVPDGKVATPKSQISKIFQPTFGATHMAKIPEGNLSEEEWEELDRDLRNIQGCDLGAWDQDFLDDTIERVARYGTSVRFTASQWNQLQRLKEQYS